MLKDEVKQKCGKIQIFRAFVMQQLQHIAAQPALMARIWPCKVKVMAARAACQKRKNSNFTKM